MEKKELLSERIKKIFSDGIEKLKKRPKPTDDEKSKKREEAKIFLFDVFGLKKKVSYKKFFEENSPTEEEYEVARKSFELNQQPLEIRKVAMEPVDKEAMEDYLSIEGTKVDEDFLSNLPTKLDALRACIAQGLLDNKDPFSYFPGRFKKFAFDTFPFWEGIFFAYCLTMIAPNTKEIPSTPIKIIDAQKRSTTLDDLLMQWPELNPYENIDAEKLYGDVIIEGGKYKGQKVVDVLSKYEGSKEEGKRAFKLSIKFNQFLVYLVDIFSNYFKDNKNFAIHLWLKGYLGINLQEKQIIDRYSYLTKK